MPGSIQVIKTDDAFLQNFQSVTEASNGTQLTVLYFTASWCGPCRRISPVYEALASEYSTCNLLKIDVDQCPSTAANYGIVSMPTFLFFIGSKKVHEFSGANDSLLKSKIAELSSSDSSVDTRADKENDVKKFQDVCNCSEQEAKHYLSAFSNDLESAITGFLSGEGGDVGEASSVRDASAPNASNNTSQDKHRVATISSMRAQTNDSDKDDEEGQAFYVGGSEGGGGQQVLGPKKDKKPHISPGNNGEFVTKLFESAKNNGAEVMDTVRVQDPSKPKIKAFTGTAHRLGTDLSEPSRIVQGSSNSTQESEKPTVIKMWCNGFSLDDGPLREFTDPASREFIESIQRGEVPPELLKTVRSGQANVMLEDHRTEEYKAPEKPKVVPFSGTGNMLGSATPAIITSSTSSSIAPVPTEPGPEVNRDKPVTKLQIRLTDGSRLTIELNHDHTVGDIRRSITSQRPNYSGAQFSLMTTFPNKELSDETVTLEEAKLLNSAIVQKLK